MQPRVTIVGGGLAGCEAAWQLARRGVGVDLFEMRPVKGTPVHQTADFAELVCSNSLRGDALDQAAGLLKEEMRRMDSLILRVADSVRVPAGSALAVDRGLFAAKVTEAVQALPEIRVYREEVSRIPDATLAIVATGPLTSEALAADVARFVGADHLYFFDAVSPVIEAESIDVTRTFRASRYGKGGDDYVNCPLNEAEYRAFFAALTTAESAEIHAFEHEFFFEGCLPVEVIASRGPETLLFGPMKPVGLVDPKTGRRPFAVVQLRQDNLAASHFSMVGFQTQLKWGEQKRVRPGLFFAGQMSGVEGYVESAASGLIAGVSAASRAAGQEPRCFPEESALGALGRYIARSDPKNYQPTNIAFGLLPELSERVRDKSLKRRAIAARALNALGVFMAQGVEGEAITR